MQIRNFFADSKSRAQELSNDVLVSYLDIKYGIKRGGSNSLPPPSVSWFSSTPARIGLRKLYESSWCYKSMIPNESFEYASWEAIIFEYDRDVLYNHKFRSSINSVSAFLGLLSFP